MSDTYQARVEYLKDIPNDHLEFVCKETEKELIAYMMERLESDKLHAVEYRKKHYEWTNEDSIVVHYGAKFAVNVTPIVRCCECTHNVGLISGDGFSDCDIVCDLWESDGFNSHDFCSNGELYTGQRLWWQE